MEPVTWQLKNEKFPISDVGVLSRAHEVIFDRSLKVLPTIEILRVTLNRTSASNLLGEVIKRTPNVKTLTVKCNLMIQHINFEDISTHLPKLTKLRWTIHSCASLRYRLDAMITGLPKKFCKKLAPKFRDVDHLTAEETSRYWKRCNPSILDLKGRTPRKQRNSNHFYSFLYIFFVFRIETSRYSFR